jgi:CHAT domain-containing protein
VADALRAAKLELRRKRATAHPFYWASFVLITK